MLNGWNKIYKEFAQSYHIGKIANLSYLRKVLRLFSSLIKSLKVIQKIKSTYNLFRVILQNVTSWFIAPWSKSSVICKWSPFYFISIISA